MPSFCGIADIFAWIALDSRGTPTVAARTRLTSGAIGQASVPSGASAGSHEAHELRDGGTRYGGRGVSIAVEKIINEIRPLLLARDARDMEALDSVMRSADGTSDLSSLGANAILAVSLSSAIAVANHDGEPLYRSLLGGQRPLLPMPMINIISGGAHAAHSLDIQDVLVMPVGAATFSQAIEWSWEIRRAATHLIKERAGNLASLLVADEGGLAMNFTSNEAAMELVVDAITAVGLTPGRDVSLAIDVAANELFDKATGEYVLRLDDRRLSSDDMRELVVSWSRTFPIVSIEDPLAEDDWDAWEAISGQLNHQVQLVGDDLLVTQSQRLARAVERGVANAVLVKVNQVGSLVAAHSTLVEAQGFGYATVVSARSGDTEDAWLADLAVGWRSGQIKIGSLTRSERLAKYNRLLQIEAEEGPSADFAGASCVAGPRSSRYPSETGFRVDDGDV